MRSVRDGKSSAARRVPRVTDAKIASEPGERNVIIRCLSFWYGRRPLASAPVSRNIAKNTWMRADAELPMRPRIATLGRPAGMVICRARLREIDTPSAAAERASRDHRRPCPFRAAGLPRRGGVGRRQFPSVKVAAEDGAFRFAFAGNDAKRPVPAGMSDAESAASGSPTTASTSRWSAAGSTCSATTFPADEGADWSRYFNEHMLKGVAPYPFLVPLATVPMQSGKHAAKVLEEALDAGLPRRHDRHPAEGRDRRARRSGPRSVLGGGVAAQGDAVRASDVRRARRAAARPTASSARSAASPTPRSRSRGCSIPAICALSRAPSLVISHGGAALPMVLGRLRRSFADGAGAEQGSRWKASAALLRHHRLRCRDAALRRRAGRRRPGADGHRPAVHHRRDGAGAVRRRRRSSAPMERAAILGDTAAKLFHRSARVDPCREPATRAHGIGQPVRRREDLRLITGQGRYSDDLNLPGQAHAAIVRSPHAHAAHPRRSTRPRRWRCPA